MKFDKPMSDQVINDLSQAIALGLGIVADQATVDVLRQSTHPDVNLVIGNIHVSDLKHTLIMGCTGNAHRHIYEKSMRYRKKK